MHDPGTRKPESVLPRRHWLLLHRFCRAHGVYNVHSSDQEMGQGMNNLSNFGKIQTRNCGLDGIRPIETKQVASSTHGSVGYIYYVHRAYDEAGPFGVLWLHMA